MHSLKTTKARRAVFRDCLFEDKENCQFENTWAVLVKFLIVLKTDEYSNLKTPLPFNSNVHQRNCFLWQMLGQELPAFAVFQPKKAASVHFLAGASVSRSDIQPRHFLRPTKWLWRNPGGSGQSMKQNLSLKIVTTAGEPSRGRCSAICKQNRFNTVKDDILGDVLCSTTLFNKFSIECFKYFITN